MADLTTSEKNILEHLFGMGGGYVLDFSDRTIDEFFMDELGINFYDEKYNYESGSKANRMRKFWRISDNRLVAESILKLLEYIETQIVIGQLDKKNFPDNEIEFAKNIAGKLKGGTPKEIKLQEASIIDKNITIVLNEKIFAHVRRLLSNKHYSNAIEEAYKVVREKLKEITGEEKATHAFNKDNYHLLFGHDSINDAEKDFFEGVKFLHMAIQMLRNQLAHTPAKEIDKNLAIHHIVLASLAYSLIDRN